MAQIALSEKHALSNKRLLILAILLLLAALLTGLFLLRPQFPALVNVSAGDAAASASAATTLNTRAAGAFALADSNDKLLVWLAPGQNPGEQTAPGQLVFVDGTGGTTPVMDVPAQTSVVMPCGD